MIKRGEKKSTESLQHYRMVEIEYNFLSSLNHCILSFIDEFQITF